MPQQARIERQREQERDARDGERREHDGNGPVEPDGGRDGHRAPADGYLARLLKPWRWLAVVALLLGPGPGARAAGPPGLEPGLPDAVRGRVDADRYAITSADGGRGSEYRAANPAHRFAIRFEPTGVRVLLQAAGGSVSWGLDLAQWGRTGAWQRAGPAVLRAEDDRLALSRGGIEEWFVNSPEGLEHGFTIPHRPSGDPARQLVLDLRIRGGLRPLFDADGQAVDFLGAGCVGVLRYAKLLVIDAAGTVLPSRFEAGAGSVRIVVEDGTAIYPVVVDPLATSAAWIASGEQDGSGFGFSVGTAGDVNGDGYSDVVVGADGYAGAGLVRGRAYLFLGSASGPASGAAWTADGDEDGAGFGFAVGTAGDVNGDGYADVVVGAPFHDAGAGVGANRGRAYLYLGSPSGLGASPAWTGSGDDDGGSFGDAVGTAGDVNGDGYSDVVIGADRHDAGGTSRGRAYVYLGSASGLGASASWTASGDTDGARLGFSVATGGDVDGDGYSDVLAGALLHPGGGSSRGRAYLYRGGPSGLGAVAAWAGSGELDGDFFGHAVATAGDVDGDGYADVLVGAYSHNAGGVDRGRAYLFRGSGAGLLASASWTGTGDEDVAYFGVAVATAGDVNGDGYADVVVGASHHDAGAGPGADRGRADLFLGSSAGLAVAPAWTGLGDQDGAYYGRSVATAGDTSGDGHSDVIVGAWYHDGGGAFRGSAFAYLGSAGGLAAVPGWTGSGDENGATLGFSSARAGDVNGDGYSDVVVGAYLHDAGGANRGRAYLHLGSAAGPTPGAAISGDEDGAELGSAVASAGDVNGDGFVDLVIGARRHDAGGGAGADRGRAYVHLGSAAGPGTSAAWTVSGDEDQASLGTSAAGAGDVNGDGYADVVVAAHLHDAGQGPGADRGKAQVFLGSPVGLSTAPSWTTIGSEDDANLGTSVAPAGDVNGDGYADLLIGAPLHDAGAGAGSNRGQAYLHLGSAAGLQASAAWTGSGDENGAQYGRSVASAGDVNGDGYSDVVVGAYLHDEITGVDAGRAYLYLGAPWGLSASPAWAAAGDEPAAYFGWAVGTAGDVNGDGYSDLVVGAWGHDAGAGSNRGRVYVYVGSASGPAGAPSWISSGDEDLAYLGYTVGSAGDMNGDGYADLLATATGHDAGAGSSANRGRAYLHLGNDGAGVPLLPRQLRADLGAPIAPLGAAHGQAFRLGLTLRSPAGRTPTRIQWQLAKLGQGFQPALNPIQSDPTWWDAGGPGPARTIPVLLPEEPIPYAWRARVSYRPSASPFLHHGPWVTLAANGLREADLLSTARSAPPPCLAPDERVWIHQVTLSVPEGFPILHFQDPNQPAERTGYHVRRSDDPVPPKSTWPLVATNVVDMDEATPNVQWTDTSGDVPPSGTWYYQVTAFNGACGVEGPF